MADNRRAMDDEASEPITGEAKALDDEIERYRRKSDTFDPVRHRRRRRLAGAILVGALGAGLVSVVMYAVDQARNPCQRVRNYYCGLHGDAGKDKLMCESYEGILRDSVEDTSAMARGAIREQCATRITRLREDEGVKVP